MTDEQRCDHVGVEHNVAQRQDGALDQALFVLQGVLHVVQLVGAAVHRVAVIDRQGARFGIELEPVGNEDLDLVDRPTFDQEIHPRLQVALQFGFADPGHLPGESQLHRLRQLLFS